MESRRTERKSMASCIFMVCSTLILVLFLIVAPPYNTAPARADVAEAAFHSTPQDFSNHPVYSTYKFDNTESVINIGTQPLYMPTGLIIETMKRDIIFREALDERGVDIRFFPFLKGHDVNFFFKSGDLDGGFVGDMPAISIAIEMEVVIASLVQSGFISIVAGKHMTIDELRGKRIAVALGSNAHYALLNSLSNAGLDESHVEILYMDVSDMPGALNKGEVHAFAAWEPTPTIAVKKYPGSTVIHRSLSSGYFYFDKGFYDRSPDIVSLLLAAEVRALGWIKRDRQNLMRACGWAIDAFNELAGRRFVLTHKEVSNMALVDIIGSRFSPIIPRKDTLEGSRIFNEFEFLRDLGKIPAASKWEKLQGSFDREVLKKIILNREVWRVDDFKYDTDEGKDE